MPTDVEIRRLAAGEATSLTALRRAWVEEDAERKVDDQTFSVRMSEWLVQESEHRRYFVASQGATPLGMVNITIFERMPRPGHPPSRWCYLGNAFVVAEHRNKGIGRRLLDAAIDEARSLCAVRVVLSPNQRSRAFYVRAGLRPASDLLVVDL